MVQKKILLTEDEMPRQWYNILPDMPNGMQPPLHPGTGQPVGPDDLAPVFPMNLIEQEVSPAALYRHPRSGPGKIPDLAAYASGQGLWPGRIFANPGQNLLSKMRGSARPEVINPTPPWLRPITTKSLGPNGSPPKPGPDNGAAP